MLRTATALALILTSVAPVANATMPAIPGFTIYFPCASSEMTPEGEDFITKALPELTDPYTRSIQVSGFDYTADSDAAAMSISEKRAQSVKAALIRHGVAGNKVSVAWLGKHDFAPDDTTRAPEPRYCRVTVAIF